jgi:hypothetical protein
VPAGPEIESRAGQPYVAIKTQVTMETLGAVVPPLNQEVFAWLGERGAVPSGPPFWKYNVIDMSRKLEVEAGVPVAQRLTGAGREPERRFPARMAGHERSGSGVTPGFASAGRRG